MEEGKEDGGGGWREEEEEEEWMKLDSYEKMKGRREK